MSSLRNIPCPCGSGRKYKKCCLKNDETLAAQTRRKQQAQQASERQQAVELQAGIDELTDLSNQANDLIREQKWEQAFSTCAELQERFPDEIDADERFSEYYRGTNDPVNELKHLRNLQRKCEEFPEGFEPEWLEELQENITRLEKVHGGT